jgi:bifunctional N-acetylglucosamine-1-phosphate-uridyltransferase/glucosamine-1-phosphate-acetyltransferase GlmU-like protein
MQAEQTLKGFRGDVLVLSGDVPMLTYETTRRLIEFHRTHAATVTLLTAILDDAAGYGRVVRDGAGNVVAIVEHKDASEDQRRIREINSGIYVFDSSSLIEGLRSISPDNVQKEYYLTDVVGFLQGKGRKVCALTATDSREIQGVNTVQDLEFARNVMSGSKLGSHSV